MIPTPRIWLALLLAVCTLGAGAATLPQPSGRVLLTVTGNITNTNAEGRAEFDRAMLAALERRVTRTSTPWHDGVVSFEGPLGRALLEAVGARGRTMKVTALNDYTAEVPVADFREHEVILAMKQDGRTMRVRDKGPLFIVYPFDEEPRLRSDLYLSRSVWQIKSIAIE